MVWSDCKLMSGQFYADRGEFLFNRREQLLRSGCLICAAERFQFGAESLHTKRAEIAAAPFHRGRGRRERVRVLQMRACLLQELRDRLREEIEEFREDVRDALFGYGIQIREHT